MVLQCSFLDENHIINTHIASILPAGGTSTGTGNGDTVDTGNTGYIDAM